MVEKPQGRSGRDDPTDGFEDAVKTLRIQSIELIGTLEIISQQAPMFQDKFNPDDSKRTAAIQLTIELTNKVTKLDAFARKLMDIVFIGDPNETKNRLPSANQQSSTEHQ